MLLFGVSPVSIGRLSVMGGIFGLLSIVFLLVYDVLGFLLCQIGADSNS